MEIKAIETHYNDYKFRSRLEARWAVFFGHLGIEYQYEPEGFDLDGVWYLPDFFLIENELWVEIKPTYPSYNEQSKAHLLAIKKHCNVVILCGEPWVDPEAEFYNDYDELKRDWHKYQGVVFWGDYPHETSLKKNHEYSWEDEFEILRAFLLERERENNRAFTRPITQDPLSENAIREIIARDVEYYYYKFAQPNPRWVLGRKTETHLWGRKNGEYILFKLRNIVDAQQSGAFDLALIEAYSQARKASF